MRYKSCYWIDGGIDFRQDNICLCCFSWLQNYPEYLLVPEYNGGKIDWDKVFERKHLLRDLQLKGETADFCTGCIYQEEQDWYNEDFFYCLALNHYSICNSRCIYCDCGNDEELRNQPYYDLAPILKEMIDNGLLKSVCGSFVTFGGGEPTMLRDFDLIIKYLSDANFSNMRINTSSIKYSETISKGLQEGYLNIVVSPDAGSSETYKKIKRVDCFDLVWKNIETYYKYAKNKEDVAVKYIIIPDVNDTEKELIDFYNQVMSKNIVSVGLTVESYWASKNPELLKKDKRVNRIHDLLMFGEQKFKESGLKFEMASDGLSFINNVKILNR